MIMSEIKEKKNSKGYDVVNEMSEMERTTSRLVSIGDWFATAFQGVALLGLYKLGGSVIGKVTSKDEETDRLAI